MPKEVVYGQQHGLSDEESPRVPIIEVRWSREAGYIQVVTKAVEPSEGRYAGDSPESHVTDGYHVNVERHQVNDLIRHLRRARDQAFGRDE